MADRPNILWYCTDQQRFDTIARLGNQHISTPRIDHLTEQSTTFVNACCQSPICTPSRASFLTGMYPSALSVNGNGNARFPSCFEDRLITHRLAASGYQCGLVGKLHLAGAAGGREHRAQDGYRYIRYSHSTLGPCFDGNDWAQWLRSQGADPEQILISLNPKQYREGTKLKSFGGVYEPTANEDNIPPHLHQTHWCTDRAIEFIDQACQSQSPWLLSINPFDPHPPFDAPWEYYRRYDPDSLPGAHFREGDLVHQQRLTDAGVDFQSKPQHPDAWEHRKVQASYYAMIEQIDFEFGRLLDYLETSGLRDNTIVIFTSDHGESLCDHGLVLKGCRFMEGMVRVPLIVSWPGHFEQDVLSDALVELIDIAPTLYESVGAPIPDFVQGRSLMSILTGQSSLAEHRGFVRSEFYGAIDHPDQTHATMYRDRRWKLVCYHNKDLYELYDLESDPWEHNDLSGDPKHQDIKWVLLSKSFDAAISAHPVGPPRTMPF